MTTIERDEMDEWRAANPEAALAEAISVAIGLRVGAFCCRPPRWWQVPTARSSSQIEANVVGWRRQ
jgi:hypothetical protein